MFISKTDDNKTFVLFEWFKHAFHSVPPVISLIVAQLIFLSGSLAITGLLLFMLVNSGVLHCFNGPNIIYIKRWCSSIL